MLIMRKIIIGFTGLAGAGKSTAARILADHAGFTVLPFAGPLKAMTRAFGLTPTEMTIFKELPLERLNGKSPRQFMQLLGTEFGRELIGQNVWVEAWRNSLEIDRQSFKLPLDRIGDILACADDVRFENEAAAIRAEGGIVVRIEREGAGSATGASHASEAGVRPDLTIQNDGDVATFTAQILGLLDRQFAAEAI